MYVLHQDMVAVKMVEQRQEALMEKAAQLIVPEGGTAVALIMSLLLEVQMERGVQMIVPPHPMDVVLTGRQLLEVPTEKGVLLNVIDIDWDVVRII